MPSCREAGCEVDAGVKGLCPRHYQRRWAEAHPGYRREKVREWRERNPEAVARERDPNARR